MFVIVPYNSINDSLLLLLLMPRDRHPTKATKLAFVQFNKISKKKKKIQMEMLEKSKNNREKKKKR